MFTCITYGIFASWNKDLYLLTIIYLVQLNKSCRLKLQAGFINKIKNLFNETCLNQCKTYKIIECRILDIYKQSLMSSFSTSPKSRLYQHLVDNFCLQTYLRRPINYT